MCFSTTNLDTNAFELYNVEQLYVAAIAPEMDSIGTRETGKRIHQYVYSTCQYIRVCPVFNTHVDTNAFKLYNAEQLYVAAVALGNG